MRETLNVVKDGNERAAAALLAEVGGCTAVEFS
jgi:hypothetical protein